MTTMVRDSVESLFFTLSERDQKDISGDPVEVSLAIRGVSPSVWLPCTYVGPTTDEHGKPATKWRTASDITWSTANYPASAYFVYAKLADSPATPLAQIGLLNIR